jgi:hypothetical protein
MNIDNLTKVRDFVASLPPERFNMVWWRNGNLMHDCGTCGCIGGWTDALFPDSFRAGITLGLTNEQEDALFYPPEFCEHSTTIEQAVHAINTLIETGMPEWI